MSATRVDTPATLRAELAGDALIAAWVRAGWTGERIVATLRMGRSKVLPKVAQVREELAAIGWRPPVRLDEIGRRTR
jgi:hypothetical protein